MILKQYELQNEVYSIIACQKEEIPSHIERVSSYWQLSSNNVPTTSLETSIDTGNAFKVVNSKNELKAVVYLYPVFDYTVRGLLLWFENKRMLAMLHHYIQFNTEYNTIQFIPDSRDKIVFRFLVTDPSIKQFIETGYPLEITRSSKKTKILYEDHYIRYNIKEL